MTKLTVEAGTSICLGPQGGIDDHAHVFDQPSIDAVNAALAVRRPLLIRGEPGVGKSQLARAVANALQRAFLPFVVDIRTEARDLLWDFDAVARLAAAQIAGAKVESQTEAEDQLAERNFVRPGPLWWAFNWKSARAQADHVGMDAPLETDGAVPRDRNQIPLNGSVVLIDEIDKAETDVPNGLLEALGAGTFKPPGDVERVSVEGVRPLVMITSNAERVLPDAFVRRCLFLSLTLPDDDLTKMKSDLIQRGKAHFPKLAVDLLNEAAVQLIDDRQRAIKKRLSPRPGLAEYIDLLRALADMAAEGLTAQQEALKRIKPYILEKHHSAF